MKKGGYGESIFLLPVIPSVKLVYLCQINPDDFMIYDLVYFKLYFISG
jgi:hypothetical protein